MLYTIGCLISVQAGENGKSMLTLEDIARKAKVSRSTVSRILNQSNGKSSHVYSEDTKKKILDIAANMGYQPNALARSFRLKKSFTIGFLAPCLVGPLALLELEEMERLFAEKGYRIFLGFTQYKPELVKDYLREFTSRRVDGAVLLGEPSQLREIFTQLAHDRIPAVGIGPLEGIGISYVDVDRRQGAYQLVRHLVADHQYREIASFGADPQCSAIIQRFEGYRQALVEGGVAFDEKLSFDHYGTAREAEIFQLGRHQVEECFNRLGRMPRAIFAHNDQKAIAVIRELIRRGYRVPQDVAVVGFDGLDIGAELTVGLTTVRQPREQISRETVKLLLDQIENGIPEKPVEVILKTQLVIRESCGCPAG
jgi:DNA-binding LacI/PurR family transcriptional regulator